MLILFSLTFTWTLAAVSPSVTERNSFELKNIYITNRSNENTHAHTHTRRHQWVHHETTTTSLSPSGLCLDSISMNLFHSENAALSQLSEFVIQSCCSSNFFTSRTPELAGIRPESPPHPRFDKILSQSPTSDEISALRYFITERFRNIGRK